METSFTPIDSLMFGVQILWFNTQPCLWYTTEYLKIFLFFLDIDLHCVAWPHCGLKLLIKEDPEMLSSERAAVQTARPLIQFTSNDLVSCASPSRLGALQVTRWHTDDHVFIAEVSPLSACYFGWSCPPTLSRTALTSLLITALTALEVRFCTSAAISCLFQPNVSPPAATMLSPTFHFHQPVPPPTPRCSKACCPSSHLSPCLDNPPHFPVAKAWFLIKPSNCEVKSQFHAPYSW